MFCYTDTCYRCGVRQSYTPLWKGMCDDCLDKQAKLVEELSKNKCSCCNKQLNKDNCTAITNTCDDCLADQAADDRVIEWENGIGFE